MAERIVDTGPALEEIKTRYGQGVPLTAQQMDNNLNYLADAVNLVSASLADSSANSSGTSGTAGSSGTSGEQGSSGTNGTSGIDGTSGNDGPPGNDGTDGVSGTSGTDGASGTDGSAGTSGTSGTGAQGDSGTDGSAGTSGTDGAAGSPGEAGSSGTSGTSITEALTIADGVPTQVIGVDSITFSGATVTDDGGGAITVTISGGGGGGGTNGTAGTSGTSGTAGGVGVPGTSGTSGISGGSGIGIFTSSLSTGVDFETTSSIRVTKDLYVDGAITASAYKIEGAVGDPAIVSETNIILSASWDYAVIVKDAPLRLVGGVRTDAGATPTGGDIYYDSDDETIYFSKGDSNWVPLLSTQSLSGNDYISNISITDNIITFTGNGSAFDGDIILPNGIISSSDQIINTLLTNSIPNGKLENSDITINGVAVDLGSSITSEEILSGTGVLSGSVGGVQSDEFNQFTAKQVFHTDGIEVTGSIVQGFGDISIVEDPGNLVSSGYGLILQQPNSKLRVGPNYILGGDRDFVDIVTSDSKTQLISSTGEFSIENNSVISSSIKLKNTSIELSGSFYISGSTTINLASEESIPRHHFILARTLDPSLREFDLTMGYGPTGSYYIGSNLYYDDTENFVKNSEDVFGWKINFKNDSDGISDKLSFDYQAPNSTENTASALYFNRGFDGGVQANISGDLNLNTGDLTVTAGNLSVSTGNISSVDLSLSGDITASGKVLFQDSLVVTGSMDVVVTGNPLTSSISVNNFGYFTLPHVSQSLDFADDTEAAQGGVPLGGVYRNGNFLMIRIV